MPGLPRLPSLPTPGEVTHLLRVLAEAGLIRPLRPSQLAQIGLAAARWGISAATGVAANAVRHPDQPAVIEPHRVVLWADLHRRTSAIANSLAGAGISAGDAVGVLCRNGLTYVDAVVALSKLGADAVLMNTGFAAPQLADVATREGVVALLHDDELGGLAAAAGVRCWSGADLEALAAQGDSTDPPVPGRSGRQVILTSGTTGTPKGAPRAQPSSLDPAVALLETIPLRSEERTVIAAPMFHAWGFAHLMIGLLLGSGYVVEPRFDAERTLAAIERNAATSLVAVPVMLQRLVDLPEESRRRYDVSSLRAVAVSGSALPAGLATRFMDAFGDVLYNLYGSTEVAWATIATPADLRAAPGTAGRPPTGTVIRLLDEHGGEVPRGDTGRIFVGNELLFDGYTGGGGKQRVDGLMSTGDLGWFDDDGRLFVAGRDDDMIVSGGENVFPAEVEDAIVEHPDVAEVAVVGVPDDEWGQRLRAVVVRRDGASLDADDVRRWVKERLARHKVPRDVDFLDALPRNPTGKVVRREL